ncbi:MAG: PIN domain-containing protein [Sneathiellaceae bacterium]
MPFLLDTNVISETVRPSPDPHVLAWLESQTPRDLYLAAMTIGELVRGARRLADGPQRDRLQTWIERDLTAQFEGRIVPFDDAAARLWGALMGDGDRRGRPQGR